MESMQSMFDRILPLLGDLLKPIAILVIGWIVVSLVASAIRKLLAKTELDNVLAAKLLGRDATRPIQVERGLSKATYIIGMTFVVVAFLESLQLATVSEPLNRFLQSIFNFVPRLLGAAALIAVAWAVATFVRVVAKKALISAGVDAKLSTEESPSEIKLSKTVAETLYWAVFLLFLPAVLDALALQGVLGPIQNMVDKALSALPNLLSAGLIIAVGFFAARIVQRVITNLVAAAGLDRFVADHGLRSSPTRSPSALVGLLAYALILIPVIIAGLNQLGLEAVTGPASAMLETLLAAVPGLLGAALILVLTYVVGNMAAGLLAGILAGIGFDSLPARLGLPQPPPAAMAPSVIAGRLLLVIFMLFATVEACEALGFSALAAILTRFINFGGHVLLGTAIVAVGLYLGRVVADALADSQLPQAELLALLARISVLVLATSMGLSEMGFGEDIIRLSFGLLVGSLAVAAALAFGLGGREVASGLLERWLKKASRNVNGAAPAPLPEDSNTSQTP